MNFIDFHTKHHLNEETSRFITATFRLSSDDIKGLFETKGRVFFQGKEYQIIDPKYWPIHLGKEMDFFITLKELTNKEEDIQE